MQWLSSTDPLRSNKKMTTCFLSTAHENNSKYSLKPLLVTLRKEGDRCDPGALQLAALIKRMKIDKDRGILRGLFVATVLVLPLKSVCGLTVCQCRQLGVGVLEVSLKLSSNQQCMISFIFFFS